MWSRGGQAEPHGGTEARAQARIDPSGMRSVVAAAWRGAHRPIPIPLARRGRDTGRGVLGRDGPADRTGEDPTRWSLQLQGGSAGTLREDSPRGFFAATILGHSS